MNNDNKLNIKQESLFTEEEVPTVELPTSTKKRKQENRIQCFIDRTNTLDRINFLSENFNTPRNVIFNQLIEVGLPILEKRYNIYSSSDEQNIINQKDAIIEEQKKMIEDLKEQNQNLTSIIAKLDSSIKSLNNNLIDINASVSIQEYINSSTYEHLKFLLKIFIATQGAGALSEELSNQYDNRIASQFKDKKEEALTNYHLSKSKVYNEFVNKNRKDDK